ncbi:MAG: helix-hairpin-helix domain-containing protein [Pseudohongiellaceae bacterium]
MKGFMLLKAAFVSVLLIFSQPGLGQDLTQSPEAGIEVEQVNINQADVATIAQVLDGIGMSRAEAIVSWREEFGNFETLEDLLEVNGIGEVTVQRNQHKILFD